MHQFIHETGQQTKVIFITNIVNQSQYIAFIAFINPENFGTNLGQENDEGLIVFCYQEGNIVTDGDDQIIESD